jgi:large subunit ribosomal protein L24
MAGGTATTRGTRVPDIRQGDEVLVLSGKDAGKRGTVERVVRERSGQRMMGTQRVGRRRTPLSELAVVVEGLNIARRHTKPRPKQGRTDRQPRVQQGGILDIAQPIHASKVMIVCPHCGQPTRVRHGRAGDGRTIRLCSNCGETLSREGKKA